MEQIDDIVINFDKSGIMLVNVTLAFIMFGIALDLKLSSFNLLVRNPKSILVGLISQLILLPLFTFLLILFLKPQASIALGMILVASCPGGNISNFITSIAKGNAELSIVLTIITSLSAIFMTPFNFAFYGNLYEPTATILRSINLDWIEVMMTIALIILVPIFLGLLSKNKFPNFVANWQNRIKIISMLLFLIIVAAALFSNLDFFVQCIGMIFLTVLIHNMIGLVLGYSISHISRLDLRDKRTISIETGIQNSGLGLLIIFSFFDGMGGMAILAAWWGIWHIISGFGIAYFWNRNLIE